MTIYVLFVFFLQKESKRLTQVIEHQQRDIPRLKACVSTSVVAFKAHFKYFDDDKLTVSVDKVIKWNSAEFNQGRAYDTSTGEFTCVTEGLYAFKVHVQGNQDAKVCLNLQLNGLRKVGLYKDRLDQVDDASMSYVGELKRGDKVKVFTSCESTLYQISFNYFSGYLIRSADCNTP